MGKIKYTQHIPNWAELEPYKNEYDTLAELLSDKKIIRWLDSRENGVLVYSCEDNYLMVTSITKKFWWVLGMVEGIDLEQYLPKSTTISEILKKEKKEGKQ